MLSPVWLLVPDTLGPSLGQAPAGGSPNPHELHIPISLNNVAFSVHSIGCSTNLLLYLEVELELDLSCQGLGQTLVGVASWDNFIISQRTLALSELFCVCDRDKQIIMKDVCNYKKKRRVQRIMLSCLSLYSEDRLIKAVCASGFNDFVFIYRKWQKLL